MYLEIKNGDVFINGKQIAQLCFDPESIGMALSRFLEKEEYEVPNLVGSTDYAWIGGTLTDCKRIVAEASNETFVHGNEEVAGALERAINKLEGIEEALGRVSWT